MRSWQEMKDFSYVGIKVTKAKSLSEGLQKCKHQKLTRQNPLYEHLKLHKLLKGSKRCKLCSKTSAESSKKLASFEKKVDIPKEICVSNQKRSATEPLRKIAIPLNRKNTLSISNNSPRRIPSPKHQQRPQSCFEQATQRFNNLKKIINNFNNRLNNTRSCFFKMQKNSKRLNAYFMTEVDQIEHQIDEDKTLSVAQVKSNRMHLEEEYQKFKQWQKAVSNKVKQMNQPVVFPLNQVQMKRIIQNAKIKNNSLVGLNKMVRSIYAYKSSMNFQNKMKIINNQSKK